jgi:hypothetical protein
VKPLKLGPHDGKLDGDVVKLTRRGLLTVVVRTTGLVNGGAHLNESEALPVPAVCEKVMVIGFVDQRAFEEELETVAAKTEA